MKTGKSPDLNPNLGRRRVTIEIDPAWHRDSAKLKFRDVWGDHRRGCKVCSSSRKGRWVFCDEGLKRFREHSQHNAIADFGEDILRRQEEAKERGYAAPGD